MTKHMRLVVSVLFIVIIVLAVAITRFYSKTSQSTELSGTQPAIEKKLGSDASGNHIFMDSAGLYGIVDSNDRVIVYPEWQQIEFTGSDLCIASKQIRDKKLFGCIDYESNIAVPFIYSEITQLKLSNRIFYAARSSCDRSYVIYDQNFYPCFSEAWTSCKTDGDELVLGTKQGIYRYTVTANDIVFRNAAVKGSTMDKSYDIEVTNKNLLSVLSVSSLEKMSKAVGRYIEYAFEGDSHLLSDIDAEQSAVFLTLFPEDHAVTSKKLMGLSDAIVYSAISDDGYKHYKVYITANIYAGYKDSDAKTKYTRGDYKALLEFKYIPEKGLRVISGDFVPNKLSYPITSAENKQPSDADGSTDQQQAH